MIFYSRQRIKFSMKEWLELKKWIFSKSDESVKNFEREIKTKFGKEYEVVSGDSMRDLLVFVIRYYIGKTGNKNVMLSEYNHFSNLNSIILAGGKGIFGEGKKKANIKLVSQLHGIVQDVENEEGIIIEDGAHAFGANCNGKKIGSKGVGLFSFGLGKIVTTFGGGVVVSKDKGLIEYIKNKRQMRNDSTKYNLKILFKGFIYQIFTSTWIGTFILKIIIGFLIKIGREDLLVEKTYLVKKSKQKKTFFSITNMQAEIGMNSLKKYKSENKLRVEKAKIYNSVLKLYSIKSGDIFFHFPVSLKTDKANMVKWLGWRYGLDIQDDYCENVKDLLHGRKNIQKEKIIYLPTNSEVPNYLLRSFVREMKLLIS